MGILSIFSNIMNSDAKEKQEAISSLEKRLHGLFRDKSVDELTRCACISGLLARVAYVDMEIHEGEREEIKSSLMTWCNLDGALAQNIASMAIEEIKNLASLENHLYTRPLQAMLNDDEKLDLLKALFAVAASDGETDANESEEIRSITKGLCVDSRYFNAARATVLESLAALKVK